MSFPCYPKYKNSGVGWLGEVPEHWEVMPCRAFADEQTAKNDDGSIEDYLSLMANIGVIPYAEKGDVGNKKPEDLTKCKLVSKGDFVINSMNYGIGSYGLSALNGICSSVYIVLRPRLEKIESRYAFRIFENRVFQKFAQSFGNGILEHRAAINWNILKSISVGIPPKKEQVAILDFLDRETAKIDALISAQSRLIDLLKEKRQAVISHAVTKGLDSNVPMRDFGVEWLGKVPQHWDVKPIKTVSTCNDDVLDERTPENYEIEYVEISGVNSAEGIVEKTVIQFGEAPSRARRRVQNGDVIVSTVRTYLRAIASVTNPSNNMIVSTGFAVVRPRLIDSRYLGYLFNAEFLIAKIIAKSAGISYPTINSNELIGLKIPIPPCQEQSVITAFLDHETAKIDALTTESQRVIDFLKERRSALISAAVTGKIDLRKAVNAAR
jgi:type I restriction enzyme S subunit